MRWQSMTSTWLQVLHVTSINRAGSSLPCGMAMGYLRRPGNPCPPLDSQVGVSTPSFAPTSLRTTTDSYQPRLRPCPSGKRINNLLVSICQLFSNLSEAVSTLVQIGLCRCVGAVVTVAPQCIPRDNHFLAEGHLFCPDHCFPSAAHALAVPCNPTPMVISVSQVATYLVCSHPASLCLVDHVLHGNCSVVTTSGSQRRAVAFYSRGEARCYEARCVHLLSGQVCPQLGPLTGPDPWGSTLSYQVPIPLSVLRMNVCVWLHSLVWLPETRLRLQVRLPLLWRPISVPAPILCGRRQKPYLLAGRGGHVC